MSQVFDRERIASESAAAPPHPQPIETLVGSTLGRWTVAGRLGEGAMGPVFGATSPGGTKAALHLVREELIAGPERLERFRRAAKLFQKLEHPNVPRLLDVDDARGHLFLAFELVEGRSLQYRIDHHEPLSPAEGKNLALDLLSALAVLHDRQIVHGDVKPGNVLLGPEGCWRLSGFSLAPREPGPDGVFHATPLFTSPEQAQGLVASAKGDLYSAGATVYAALASEPPFLRPSVAEILQAHVHHAPPDLAARVPEIDQDLLTLVGALLAKLPAKRPADARAALSMLEVSTRRRAKTEAALRTLESDVAPIEEPPLAPSPPPSRWSKTARRKALDLVAEEKAAAAPTEHPVVSWGRSIALRAQLKWHQRHGDLAKTAEAWSELGEYAQAGELYLDAGEPLRAADEFLKAGIPHAAAIIFERTGAHARAIDAYVASGKLDEATNLAAQTARFDELGDALEKAGQHEKAIQAFTRAGKTRRVAAIHERQGNLELAAAAYERAREYGKAAELAEKAGRTADAIRLHERAGNLARVAALYDAQGDSVNAARFRAEQELAAGRRLNAARAFEAAGLLDRAIDLFLVLNLVADAIRCAERLGAPARTAALHARAGDFRRAAALFEQAGEHREAARCHHQLGDAPAEATALERASDPLAAADVWLAVKRADDARRALAAVPPGAPDRKRAQARLGKLEAAAGRSREAAHALDEALEGVTPDPENVAAFVECGEAHLACGELERAIEWLSRVKGLPFAPPTLELRLEELEAKRRDATGAPAAGRGGKDLVGSDLDRYEALSYAGEGELVWAYDAEHVLLERPSGLCVLKPTVPEDRAQRFFADARALAVLRHPNLVEVHDAGRTSTGYAYVAIESSRDLTLRQVIKEARGPLHVARAVAIASGLLAGVAAAHEVGIVHGDLRPETVLVSAHDEARVVGFAFARHTSSVATRLSLRLASLRPYVAPEQQAGAAPDALADQFACGAILYEMLAGVHPFATTTETGAAAPLPPPVPEELAAAVLVALERDPEARHPSVADLASVVALFAPGGVAAVKE